MGKVDCNGVEFTIGRKAKHRFRDGLDGYTGIVEELEEGCNALIGLNIDNEIRWFCAIDLVIID